MLEPTVTDYAAQFVTSGVDCYSEVLYLTITLVRMLLHWRRNCFSNWCGKFEIIRLKESLGENSMKSTTNWKATLVTGSITFGNYVWQKCSKRMKRYYKCFQFQPGLRRYIAINSKYVVKYVFFYYHE